MMSIGSVSGKKIICIGDQTSHGGVVVSGSGVLTVEGVPVARQGDSVTCPQCKPHQFVISEGSDIFDDNGVPVALDGHKTSCGADLIAS